MTYLRLGKNWCCLSLSLAKLWTNLLVPFSVSLWEMQGAGCVRESSLRSSCKMQNGAIFGDSGALNRLHV